jgi:SAM-dependent methyltransferase
MNQYQSGEYLEKVPDWHTSDSAWKAARVLKLIQKNNLRPKTIFDIGCGAGGVLAELQKKMPLDVELIGYDISPQAIMLARKNEKERLKFFGIDFSASKGASADLLLLLDVLEHVPDYLGFLQSLQGRAEWFIFHIPLDISVQSTRKKSQTIMDMRTQFGHLHYFNKETALATLRDAGYEITDYFYTDDKDGFECKNKTLKARVIRGLRRLTFRWDPDIAAFLFDHFNLLVLARGCSNT